MENKEEIIEQLVELVESLTMKPEIISVVNSIGDTISDEKAIEYLKLLNRRIDQLTQISF